MLDFFFKGGILMYPIFFSSIIATATFFERFIYLMIVQIRNKKFLENATKVKDNKLQRIKELSQEIKSPVSRLLSSVIENIDKPEEERNVILNRVGSNELRDLEKNVNLLGVITHVTPLLGLLGTVTGMIKCFMTIQKLGGQVDAVRLAGGIWEALITTAAGLSVAIPSMIFYYILVRKVDTIVSTMKDLNFYFPEFFSKYQLKPTKQIEAEGINEI